MNIPMIANAVIEVAWIAGAVVLFIYGHTIPASFCLVGAFMCGYTVRNKED